MEEEEHDDTNIQFDEEDDRAVPPHQEEEEIIPSSNDHHQHETEEEQTEEDFLLNGDIMTDTPSVSAFSDESDYQILNLTKKPSDFSLDYILSLKYILTRERILKKKKQIVGKVHKILWKQYHEPNYPQCVSIDGVNDSHFIHLVMDEIATEEDIIRVTEQFGPILYGLEIRNCLNKGVKKSPPKKRKKAKEETVIEKEDVSNPVLYSIAKNCHKMEVLKIDGNSFTEEDVEKSNLLESLPSLKIYHGPISNACLADQKKVLSKLRKLKIESEKLPHTTLKSVARYCSSSLREFKTNPETSLTFKALEDFGVECDRISTLSLRNVKFTGAKEKLTTVISEFFTNLQHLELFNENTIASTDFKKLAKLDLTHLNLTRCDNLDDTGLSVLLRDCTSLKKVILDNCWQVSEKSLKEISNLKDLSYLDITGLRVTNKTIKVLADSISSGDKFTHFICEANYNVTDDGFQVLLEKCKFLECLNVNRWEKLTDISLENIGKYLKNPKKLGLIQGFKSKARYTSEGLKKALKSRNVEYLTIQSVENINDAMLVLSENCPDLKALSVSGNEKLNDDAVEAMCEGCKHLEILDLSHCPLLSDEALNAASNSLKNLREINIIECDEVTCDGIEVMLDGCNYISTVNVKPDFAYIEKTKILFLEHSIRPNNEVSIQIR